MLTTYQIKINADTHFSLWRYDPDNQHSRVGPTFQVFDISGNGCNRVEDPATLSIVFSLIEMYLVKKAGAGQSDPTDSNQISAKAFLSVWKEYNEGRLTWQGEQNASWC